MTIRISGNFLGRTATFTQRFEMNRKTNRNSFVSRLWASRKIGLLGDELRQMGAEGAMNPASRSAAQMPADPRVKELVGEIVRLSKQFGIMTEYTAFLAREGCDLTQSDAVIAQAASAFRDRAMQTRTGPTAVNQSLNSNVQMSQVVLNNRNAFYTADMTQTAIDTVQQANDLTFFLKAGRWTDTRLYSKSGRVQPSRTIVKGTPEFLAFAEQMAAEGRGGIASLKGDVVVLFRGEPVLVQSK
jgi:hypothetical protein